MISHARTIGRAKLGLNLRCYHCLNEFYPRHEDMCKDKHTEHRGEGVENSFCYRIAGQSLARAELCAADVDIERGRSLALRSRDLLVLGVAVTRYIARPRTPSLRSRTPGIGSSPPASGRSPRTPEPRRDPSSLEVGTPRAPRFGSAGLSRASSLAR